MKILSKILGFIGGVAVMVFLVCLPTILDHIGGKSEYIPTHPGRSIWQVNVEEHRLGTKNIEYFYAKAIIRNDTIERIDFPNGTFYTTDNFIKRKRLYENDNEFYEGLLTISDSLQYEIKLVKEIKL